MKLGSTLSQAVLCNVNVIGENFIKKTTNVCPYLVKGNTSETLQFVTLLQIDLTVLYALQRVVKIQMIPILL
jgi:hypothetical protein